MTLTLGHCLLWAWLGLSVAGELVDINSASPDQLKSLPGMTEGYIMMIVGARPFQSKEDLVEQKLLPQETYDQMKNQIFVKGGSLKSSPPSPSSRPQPNAMSGPELDEKREDAGMVSPTDSSPARTCIKEERTKERMCGELLR
ncbi:MAG TPA: helix-hairpin-helix domain-containing protein [Nitrospiraceae bacterium]|nr:helix-hairpin-helix domain-containing protein [Nitrospiraceae bacterium]